MVTSEKQTREKIKVKRYKIQYSIEEYTFPKEAYIHEVKFDEKFMHVELTDQRMLSIPLWWIPSVYNASMENRMKYKINQNRTMVLWDPDESGINDELRITDYLGPARSESRASYVPSIPKRKVVEPKAKLKKK